MPKELAVNGDATGVLLRRIGPAYEQIANQLREAILSEAVELGGKLPSETELASIFGVSRATVREALRFLAAEGLVSTTQGVNGGNFVAKPSTDRVLAHFNTSLNLLSRSMGVTLTEYMEVRDFLEVQACGLACERHSPDDVERLLATVAPGEGPARPDFSRDFHSSLIEICHNKLLSVAADSVFRVLQTKLNHSAVDPSSQREVTRQHRAIADAVANRDAPAAMELMREHLRYLTPLFERVWRGS